MKTLEEIKAISTEKQTSLENELLSFIDNNNLEGVKNFLQDYPVKISCYELTIKGKNKKGKEVSYPLFEPWRLILKAAWTCENHNNDFSLLDYFFNEYGLSLKDPKYNFNHSDMKDIEEINKEYILMKNKKGARASNALIYVYISRTNNPNPQIVRYLADKGARFDVYNGGRFDEDTYKWSPLHYWAGEMNNNLKGLEAAIKGGVNVDMEELDSIGRETPLYFAVKEPENDRTVRLLIKLGANVNHYYLMGTILDEAQGIRNKQLLKAAGAKSFGKYYNEKYHIIAEANKALNIDESNDDDITDEQLEERDRFVRQRLAEIIREEKAKKNGTDDFKEFEDDEDYMF